MLDSSIEESIHSMINSVDNQIRNVTSNSKTDKLKRPPNAYNLFFMEQQPQIKASNPNLTGNEISKEHGLKWKSMNEDQRRPYIKRAKEIHEEFKAENPNYHYIKGAKAGKKKPVTENTNTNYDAENMLFTFVIMQNKDIINSIQQSIQPNLLPQLLSEFKSKYTLKTN